MPTRSPSGLAVYLLLGLPGAAGGGEGQAYLHRIESEADFEMSVRQEGQTDQALSNQGQDDGYAP